MNFDRLRHVAERAAVGEQREMLLAEVQALRQELRAIGEELRLEAAAHAEALAAEAGLGPIIAALPGHGAGFLVDFVYVDRADSEDARIARATSLRAAESRPKSGASRPR